MTNNDKKRFWAVMKALEEWAGVPATKEKGEIYFRALGDLDIEAIETAVWHIIGHRTTSSFPKPGEIREALAGNGDDRAQLAIMTLENALRTYSPYESVSFADNSLNFIVSRYGGWPKLCEVTTDEWKFLKKDLEKQFKAISALHPTHIEQIEYLPGIIETTNATNGIDLKQPITRIDFSPGARALKIEAMAERKRIE